MLLVMLVNWQNMDPLRILYAKIIKNYIVGSILLIFLKLKSYRINFARNIAEGMIEVHANGILHRDLKASNILVFENSRSKGASKEFNQEPKPIAKISDFGISKLKYLDSKEDSKYINNYISTLAPETLSSGEITEESEVFSFAVILWQMLTFQIDPIFLRPNGTRMPDIEVKDFVMNGGRLPLPDTTANTQVKYINYKKYVELINSCWRQNPLDRPTFKQIAIILSNLDEFPYAMKSTNNSPSSATSTPPTSTSQAYQTK